MSISYFYVKNWFRFKAIRSKIYSGLVGFCRIEFDFEHDSGRSFLVWVISVNGYVSVTKIDYSSGSAIPFSVVNRFGYNFGSGIVGSIKLKKGTHFRVDLLSVSGRVTFERL